MTRKIVSKNAIFIITLSRNDEYFNFDVSLILNKSVINIPFTNLVESRSVDSQKAYPLQLIKVFKPVFRGNIAVRTGFPTICIGCRVRPPVTTHRPTGQKRFPTVFYVHRSPID